MKITVKANRFTTNGFGGYTEGHCVGCIHKDVCNILDAVREFPLDVPLTFDCGYAEMDEEWMKEGWGDGNEV